MSGSTFHSPSVVPVLGHNTFGGDNVVCCVKKDLIINLVGITMNSRNFAHIGKATIHRSEISIECCFNLSECKLTSLSVLNANCLVNRSLHTI